MKRFIRRAFMFLLIAGPIWFIAIVCSQIGIITIAYVGFALDDSGLVYVGKEGKLDVYDQKKYIRTIYKTTRGYRFTIQEEKILLATARSNYEMDLLGNIVKKTEDRNAKEYRKLYKQRNIFITDNARYEATNILGFFKITKFGNDGSKETVYQMRIIDFLLGTAIYVIAIIAVILFIIWLTKWWPIVHRKGIIKR